MSSALDEIDWLTRSENRIRLLTLLASSSYDRSDLQTELDIARITLNRTIAEFDEKGWIHRDDSQYTTSYLGDLIAADVSTLLETATDVRKLREHRDVFQRLPIDELNIDLHHLVDAHLTHSRSTTPSAPMSRTTELLASANHVRALVTAIEPFYMRPLWEQAIHHDQTSEIVLSAGVANDISADSQIADWIREIVETEQGRYFRYTDEIPCSIVIAKETVGMGVTGERGAKFASIETDAEEIFRWAENLFETYREKATPIGIDVFAGEGS